MERLDKKGRENFDHQLMATPPHIKDQQMRDLAGFSQQEQAESFMAMFKLRGGIGLPADSGNVSDNVEA
jgi:hypothetical protein